MEENNRYLKEQLITYLGNKRSLLTFIDSKIAIVKDELGKEKISIFDGFAGSGVVARYMKQTCNNPYSKRFGKIFICHKRFFFKKQL